jgi:hypothetical protein
VIDFDRAVRYPTHPTCWTPSTTAATTPHPNDGGYQAMADTIDLAMITC